MITAPIRCIFFRNVMRELDNALGRAIVGNQFSQHGANDQDHHQGSQQIAHALLNGIGNGRDRHVPSQIRYPGKRPGKARNAFSLNQVIKRMSRRMPENKMIKVMRFPNEN